MTQEEPKQETLEEASARLAKIHCDVRVNPNTTEFQIQQLIIKGAKWQAERMYSEGDLKETYFSAIKSTGEGWNGEYANGNNPDIKKEFTEGFEKWFEQFKKKQ